MKSHLFLAATCLSSLMAVADTETVTMTTNKPVGTELTLLVNTSKTGVSLDWGDGNPKTYAGQPTGFIEVTGTVRGTNLVLTSERPITMLSADGCGLTEISLTGAPHMRSLYLQNNELTSISLGTLAELRDLNLAHNQLKAITLSTSKNPTIETLDISDNELTTTSFSYATANLQYLALTSNNFKTLTLANASNLSSLKAADNTLSSVSVKNATNISLIDITNNGTATLTLPATYTGLQQFYAGENELSQALDFSNCKSLNTVDIHNNTLSSVLLPTVKMQAYDCGGNALTFAALPRTTQTPTAYMNYQPQDDFDMGTLTGMQAGNATTHNRPWVEYNPSYSTRQDSRYVVDMTQLRNGSNTGSVQFAFNEIATDGTETPLVLSSATNQTQDYTNVSGKVTFQRPLRKAYGVLTDPGYPELTIRTTYFTVIDPKADGITNITTGQGTTLPSYDLQGRQVSKPQTGLYIINGNKVIRK